VVATLYRRKALKWFNPDRFPGFRPAYREAWVQAVRRLQDGHVPPRLEDRLPLVHRTRSVLVRHGEVAALASLAAAQGAGRPLPALLVGGWVELQVPGLVAEPSLEVGPDLRLVPAEAASLPAAGAPVRSRALAAAGRLVRPLARRTARGRQAWAWARRTLRKS
jgi:hypothetical protein